MVSSADERVAMQIYMGLQGLVDERAWIDGSDEADEGVWRMGTGEVMPYTGFKTEEGEPNGDREENCIGLVIHGAFDITCDSNWHTKYAFCEY